MASDWSIPLKKPIKPNQDFSSLSKKQSDVMKVKTIPLSASNFSPQKNTSTKKNQKVIRKVPKLPDLKQLQSSFATSKPIKHSKRQRLKMSVEKSLRSGIPLTGIRTRQSARNYLEQRRLQNQQSRVYSTRPLKKKLIDKAALNFHFFTPEDMDKGQFNEVDKVLYSFKKRMFLSYLNSLLKSYEDLSLKKPLLKGAIESEKHLLTGKILFDKEGNIVKINILKSSLNDDVHSLFENTLIGIKALPNPPKMLLRDKEDFTIYYQLSINGR